MLQRKTFLTLAAGLALGISLPAAAQAPAFPTKPVVVYTAFAVGSGPDAVLRLVAHKLSQQWKQSVTVDNRPGGGGFIAIEAARRATPDGHTLLVGLSGLATIALYKLVFTGFKTGDGLIGLALMYSFHISDALLQLK